jgi:hypothetical protein
MFTHTLSNGFTHQKNWLPSTQRMLKPNYVRRNARALYSPEPTRGL